MSAGRLERLAALQCADGCFPSLVAARSGVTEDHNGFCTAMVVRLLRHAPSSAALAEVRSRALDFVETCAARDRPGAYGFWPGATRPPWAARVPSDVDDTALMLAELVRHGRLDRAAAMRALCTVVLPCRVRASDWAWLPPWVVPGCFHTWIADRGGAQAIDCCVNANVLALMAELGAAHLPGYAEGVAIVLAALAWAGEDRVRLASLTPFYPSLRSFAEAVAHAVECGANRLEPASRELQRLASSHDDDAGACCSSAYGHAVWRCAAIEEARAIALEHPD